MKHQNNYLSKKREIFEIEKIKKKEIVFSGKKNEFFMIIKEKKKPLRNNTYINYNTNSKKKKRIDKLKESQRQSLLAISHLVLEYIKKKKKQTGNQITEFVQNILQLKNNDKLTQKNIQRRVYDSINVMIGFGRIKKNKEELEYVNNDSNKNINLKENDNEYEINQIKNIEEEMSGDEDKDEEENNIEDEKQYKEKLKKLEELQKLLIKQYLTIKFHEKYGKINNDSKKDINDKLKSNSVISYDTIKKIIAPEILAKLNKEDNNNIYNIDIKKENNNEVNIINKINFNKNKENNNIDKINEKEDEVFNYLKNIKLFRDELTFNINNKEIELCNNNNINKNN